MFEKISKGHWTSQSTSSLDVNFMYSVFLSKIWVFFSHVIFACIGENWLILFKNVSETNLGSILH